MALSGSDQRGGGWITVYSLCSTLLQTMAPKTWRQILPRTVSDWMAFVFTVSMIQIVTIFEILVVAPEIFPETPTNFIIHVIVGLFLYFNAMANLWFLLTTDATSGPVVLPSVLKPGWRFCYCCEHNAPPRSHHCGICGVCILKRDHHCTFTGNCVGHSNQRYYLMMVMYLALSGLFCSYLNMDYTFEVLGGFSFTSLITMIVPMFSWIFGLTEVFTFTVAFISGICVVEFLFLTTLLVYHGINIYNGQTTYEKGTNIKDFDLGWKENFKSSLGKNWHVSWIFPLIPSPLPSNGIEFRKRGTPWEGTKDI